MKSPDKAVESPYPVLKNEIEETFGKKINSHGDCLLLSEDVETKVSVKISSNTLRRFFGLIKADHMPSATTRNILSKYCGFASFDEFTSLKETTHIIKEEYDKSYFSQSVINYLVSLFKTAPVYDCNDNTFINVVKHTIIFLQRHPELFEKFQRAISKTRNGQEFYYEYFINIDRLNSYYGEGLLYYLLEKTTIEAQIFGHSLLCLKYWLSENSLGVERHHSEVMKYRVTKNIDPYVCARFFATQLLYADIHKLPTEKIIIAAQQAHASAKHTTRDRVFPYFEYIIAPVLLLTGHPDKALYYINYTVGNYPKRHASLDEGLYQTMEMLKALTLVKTGRKKEALELFPQIHPSRFYFLTKKTDTIMYLVLSKHMKRSQPESDQKLKDLIAETGFTRLKRYYYL